MCVSVNREPWVPCASLWGVAAQRRAAGLSAGCVQAASRPLLLPTPGSLPCCSCKPPRAALARCFSMKVRRPLARCCRHAAATKQRSPGLLPCAARWACAAAARAAGRPSPALSLALALALAHTLTCVRFIRATTCYHLYALPLVCAPQVGILPESILPKMLVDRLVLKGTVLQVCGRCAPGGGRRAGGRAGRQADWL